MQKPDGLYGRTHEWERLVAHVNATGVEPRLGLVYGRRRQGKTMLLTSLCDLVGGFYWEALDGESAQNLVSISEAWTRWTKAPTPARFGSWPEVIDALMSAGSVAGRRVPVVLDEIARVISRVPEFPSLVQRALGPARRPEIGADVSLILCGSAFGDMRRLIDGPAPLRGRASLEMLVQPFDYRAACGFWGLDGNPGVAFAHHAFVGGTPAYRAMADRDAPTDGDLDGWVVRRLLDPSSSLFRDGRIAVNEDQQLGDQQRYWGLLSAIAEGARRWGDLETTLGQQRGSLHHALQVVIDAGWVTRIDDPLRVNRSTYLLAEPMIRFHRLVVEPRMQRLSAGRAVEVWRDARAMVAGRVLAPHLEQLTLDWAVRYASDETLGGSLAHVGPTQLESGQATQLDVAGFEAGPGQGRRLMFIGEVKATEARVGAGELDRLDRVASRLGSEGVRRLIVSRSGFTADLERTAARRSDVELVDLHRLYHGE